MLEVRGLSKSFGGLKAVDQASLDVRQGEIVGLIGPNGAGKTTLFAAIAGFHTPDAGRVAFEGKRHHRPGAASHLRRRHGAHLPDHPAVRQASACARTSWSAPTSAPPTASWPSARPRRWRAQVGMAGQLDQMGADLTVAGRKRLELARALATGRACCCSTR